MALKGPDIFASPMNLTRNFEYLKLITSLMDEGGTIKAIRDKFSESYVTGAVYTFKNLKALLGNKFIQYALFNEGITFTQLYLIKKFADNLSSGEAAVFFAMENGKSDPMQYLLKLSLQHLFKKVIDTIGEIAQNRLHESFKKELEIALGKNIFNKQNFHLVTKFNPELVKLSKYLGNILGGAQSGVSLITKELTLPFINKTESGKSFVASTLDSNPLLLFTDIFVKAVLKGNIYELSKALSKKIFTIKASPKIDYITIKEEGVEGIVFTANTPLLRSVEHFIQINKLGGGEFALDKMSSSHLYKSGTFVLKQQNPLYLPLRYTAERLEEIMLYIMVKFYNLDREKFFVLKNNLDVFSKQLNTSTPGPNILDNLNLTKLMEMLDAFKLHNSSSTEGRAIRQLSEDTSLSLANYHLDK